MDRPQELMTALKIVEGRLERPKEVSTCAIKLATFILAVQRKLDGLGGKTSRATNLYKERVKQSLLRILEAWDDADEKSRDRVIQYRVHDIENSFKALGCKAVAF